MHVQVSFTGSVEVGREVMQAAARSNLKPVSLELGGKSPLIIFDDADVDKAAELAFFGMFFNKVKLPLENSIPLKEHASYDTLDKPTFYNFREKFVLHALVCTFKKGSMMNLRRSW